MTTQEVKAMSAIETIGGIDGMEGLKIAESGIVPVYSDKEARFLVNARDLHKFLECGRQFANWIKDRIERYNFMESEDFTSFNKIVKRGSGGGTTRIEYFLSLDMAKEISMLENNDRGRMVRKYFIECEKRLRTAGGAINAEMAERLRQQEKWLAIMDRNARSRQAQILKSAAQFFKAFLSDVAMQSIISEITALIAGKRLVDLPEAEGLYSIAEIGEQCGISTSSVEQIVNELRLRTDEYGMLVLSESPDGKQLTTFQFRQKAADKIREFLDALKLKSPSKDLPLEDVYFSGFFL
jgi:phage anti-repressor protein